MKNTLSDLISGLFKSVSRKHVSLIVFGIALAVSFLYLPKVVILDAVFHPCTPSAFGFSQTSVLVEETDPLSELRPLSWPETAMPIEYSINDQTADGLNIGQSGERQETNTTIVPGTDPVQVIRDAFQAWEDTPTSFVSFTEGPQTAIGTAGLDGTNVVTFVDTTFDFDADLIRSTAVVFFERSTGTIVETDILFNPDSTFSGLPKGDAANNAAFNLRFHAMHEVGHAIGVGHVSSPDFLMYPFSATMRNGGRARRQPIWLDQDCVAAGSAIYPEDEFSLTTGRIVGAITKTGGGAIFGAEIVAVDSNGRPLVSAITRRDGTYDMRGVPAGDYELYVQAIDSPVQRDLIEFALPATFSPPFPTATFAGGAVTVDAGGPPVVADITVLSSGQGLNVNASGKDGTVSLGFFTPIAEQGENFDLVVAGTAGSTINPSSTIVASGADVALGAPTFFNTTDGLPALRVPASVSPTAVLGPVDISVTTGAEASTLTGGLRIWTPASSGTVEILDDDGPLDFGEAPVGLSETDVITVFNNGNSVQHLTPVLTNSGGGQFELLFPPSGSVVPPITALGILVKYTPEEGGGGGEIDYDSTTVPITGTPSALEAFIRVDKAKVKFKGPGRDMAKFKGLINGRPDNFDFNQPFTIQIDGFSTAPLTPLQVKAGPRGAKVFFKDRNIKVKMKLFKKGSSSGKFSISLKRQDFGVNINKPPAVNTLRLINLPFNRTSGFVSSQKPTGLSFNSRKNVTAAGPFSIAKFNVSRNPAKGDKFSIKKGILSGSNYGGPLLPDDITLRIGDFTDVVRGDDMIVAPNGKSIKYKAKRNGITSIRISLPSRMFSINGSGVDIGNLATQVDAAGNPFSTLRIVIGVGDVFTSDITLDATLKGGGKSLNY